MTGHYVFIKRDSKVVPLVGPFEDKFSAEALIEPAAVRAIHYDLWTVFDVFCAGSVTWDKPFPAGKLNAEFDVVPSSAFEME